MSALLEQLNDELALVADGIKDSLVQVRGSRGGVGAGTIWHPDGLILTNAHVVQRPPLIVTLTDGRTLEARLLATDTSRDLAALMVEASGLPTVRLADSRKVQPGQWVLAMGHPWGVAGSVTAGAVIGLEQEDGHGRWPGRQWIVVGLNLRPGYSGGPLVDARGRLLGINTMMTAHNVGMAVPVHVAAEFLREALVLGHRQAETTTA